MYNHVDKSWSLGITRRIQDHVIESVARLLHALDESNTTLNNNLDERGWMDKNEICKFSVKKCYMWLVSRKNSQQEAVYVPPKKIWSKYWPPKVSFLIWLAVNQKVLTQDNLCKRKWRDWVNHFYLCIDDGETSHHMLLHCSYANTIWRSFIELFNLVWIAPPSVEIAIHSWPNYKPKTRKDVVISTIPAAIIWNLWKERNRRTFENKSLPTTKVIQKIKFTIAYWVYQQPQFIGIALQHFMLKWKDVVFEPPRVLCVVFVCISFSSGRCFGMFGLIIVCTFRSCFVNIFPFLQY